MRQLRSALRAFLCGSAGFTGAERALLLCVALAVVGVVGVSLRGGALQAGADARRALSQGGGEAGGSLQRTAALGRAPQALGAAGAVQRVHDEGGPEAVDNRGAGAALAIDAPAPAAVAVAQQVTAPTAEVTAPAAVRTPTEQAARATFLRDYRAWLELRLTEARALPAAERVTRVEGLLSQLETVAQSLQRGQTPELATLPTAPATRNATPAGTFLPPELIGEGRRLITILEQPITGLTADAGALAEGSLFRADDDWNPRLGVPQYRTQSDNLAAPEATCNVTSLSMVLERLGYGREDVRAAIERELKTRQVRAAGGDPATTDLATVELPADAWERAVRPYLDENNNDTANYRRLRGGATTPAQRAVLARGYRDSAQMEDLLDFLLDLKGISRYEAAIQGPRIFNTIETTATQRPTAELVAPSSKLGWAQARERIQAAIDEGGAAMLSIYHKGAGQDGTHLITIQRLTEHGAIVDDPYGRIRSDYDRRRVGDAYADPGRTRGTSGYRNALHALDGDRDGVDDDWRVGAAQRPDGDERRGDSVEISDEVLARMWNRVTIYRRPIAAPAAPVAAPAAPGTPS